MGYYTNMVEEFVYFWSLIILLISVAFIFIKYGLKENIFSPLNLFIIVQILVVVFQVYFFISRDEEFIANYFRNYLPDLDFILLTLNALTYTLFNAFLFLFLILIKYKPSVRIKKYSFNISRFEYLLILGFFCFFIFKLKGFFHFSPSKILELRYGLEHGYNVLLTKFFSHFLIGLIALLLLNNTNFKNFLKKFVFYSLIVVFVLWSILTGTRGFFIFNTLFLLFLRFYKSTVVYSFKRLWQGYINTGFMYIGIVVPVILIFYYIYSITVRGYTGNILSVISQRFDYFFASYVALKKVGISFQIENVIYPFISYIPRDIWASKPFPVNTQLTYLIFGYNEKWSVNFGVAGESFYVLPIIWIFITSFLTALCLKWFSKVFQKNKLTIYDIIILSILYTYPIGVIFGGVLNPFTGDLIYLGLLLSFINYLKERRIKL